MEFRWTVKFLENRMFLTEIEASVSILVYMRDEYFWDVRFLSVKRMLQLVANFYLLFYADVV